MLIILFLIILFLTFIFWGIFLLNIGLILLMRFLLFILMYNLIASFPERAPLLILFIILSIGEDLRQNFIPKESIIEIVDNVPKEDSLEHKLVTGEKVLLLVTICIVIQLSQEFFLANFDFLVVVFQTVLQILWGQESFQDFTRVILINGTVIRDNFIDISSLNLSSFHLQTELLQEISNGLIGQFPLLDNKFYKFQRIYPIERKTHINLVSFLDIFESE